MLSEYTVVVQGEIFMLSRAQIEFDCPNLFTEHFLHTGSEPHRRQILLSRNPQLFSLIVEYLCGYAILPIHDAALPTRMSRETVLGNLRVDAEYYKLEGLKKLIDEHAPQKVLEYNQSTLLFHFPGRVTNWHNMDDWSHHHPSGYMEFPLSIDLSKCFSIVCWYKARSNVGYHTLISIDTPSAAHPLLYIAISPSRDFQFDVGVLGDPDRSSSGASGSAVQLNVWTHLAFIQEIDVANLAARRTLYLNGEKLISSYTHLPIYNPSPAQTRMAIMRGSWSHNRNAGFIGQAENIEVFQRALSQGELKARSSTTNAPADHGWPTDSAQARR